MNNIPGLSPPLTPREEDSLILLGDGHSNRQIAEELTLAPRTVKWQARQEPGAA